MRPKAFAAALGLAALVALAACGSPAGETRGDGESSPTAQPGESVTPPASPSSAAAGGAGGDVDQVVGTVVRFSSRATSVDVTIDEDNPAARDFLSMLPLTLTIEEFTGREKISYLPRELEYRDSPGSDPEDGDLIYYIPWGNLGFYYNTAGVGYSAQTVHLGTYDASLEQLELLEGEGITVEVVGKGS
ncbi:hypothetical protein I6A84_20190 [Frankia sp. CNm7]|uniref:Cyclophilin-like domain-containing protein n=1 Tax=Frankia nepalensis TaxID=1836974 RepID=A0A937RNK3_9ACTN|nr:cyclophilin-like fold protein [Frankia nepalensis]MBL7497747.1 hypothetical protein [Frankia nepalensis]MBL7512007.1 hypothetical protein [Frankia nepalensis]MBL7520345.1 hypothetical protein [Frankia nepalensis]MBL7632059.1 hypothetical protein [Frankia nepalensis]